MNKKSKSFEEALNELEKITAQLKSGETSLEDTIKLYEEGIVYYKLCKEIIEVTQEKIKVYDKELEDFREKEYGI
ncbi:MAG: exodeoxyribonuclease VII small subunit [Peptostreptococcales bacterium]